MTLNVNQRLCLAPRDLIKAIICLDIYDCNRSDKCQFNYTIKFDK